MFPVATAVGSVVFSSLVGIGLVAIVVWFKNKSWRDTVDKIPGPKAIPLFGNALDMKTDITEWYPQMEGYSKTYAKSGMFRLWMASHPVIWIYRADIVEQLVKGTANMNKSIIYHQFKSWLGDGLLLSSGNKWQKRRKMLTPTFHFKILEKFVDVFNEQSKILVERLAEKVDGNVFDIQPMIIYCTLDIICETAMGTHVDAQAKQETSSYVQAIHKLSDIFVIRFKSPWLASEALFKLSACGREWYTHLKVLHDFTKRTIADRSSVFDEILAEQTDGPSKGPNRKRLAFLDLLLAEAKTDASFTDADIQEEVDTFMFEGHDTTSSAAGFAVFAAGVYPEIQRKLQEEMDRVFGDDDDRPVTTDDVKELVYLDCFLKEVLRKYPPVFLYARQTGEDCTLGGYDIPKGCSVQVMAHRLHHDPEHFPDPEKFDPDRWLNDNNAGRHPYCYVPFSAGLRNCIGQKFATMEMKVIMCHLLRKFDITFAKSEKEFIPLGLILLKPNEVPVKLSRRKTNNNY